MRVYNKLKPNRDKKGKKMKSSRVPERRIEYRRYDNPQRPLLPAERLPVHKLSVAVAPATIPSPSAPQDQLEQLAPDTQPILEISAPRLLPTTPIYSSSSITPKKLPEKNLNSQSFEFVRKATIRPVPSLATHRITTDLRRKEIVAVQYNISTEADTLFTPAEVLPKQSKLSQWKPRLVYGLACLMVIGGVGVSLQSWQVNNKAEEQVLALTENKPEETATEGMDEREITRDAVKKYNVAPDLPRLISIEKLAVEARVLNIGVNRQNQMQTPASIFDAGWYNSSAKPGGAGAMVINGHVSGPSKPGVFKKLKTLVSGDVIQIEKGDKSTVQYEVVSSESVSADKVDMIKLLNSAVPSKPGLNIITCGGVFNSETSEFESRTIVYAVLKQ
jgi:LPXTG-site transpeptidase (sortase) family protein